MTTGAIPPPIPPEERQPARLWDAEFDPAPSSATDYYQPPPPDPGGYASWGVRVLGTLLDTLVISAPVALAQLVVVLSGDEVTGLTSPVAWLGALAALAIWGWNVVWRQGRSGQTLGKSWVGVRLVDASKGAPLGPGTTFVRALAHVLDALPCYLGFLWPLWDATRQTFADKIVGSVVVRV